MGVINHSLNKCCCDSNEKDFEKRLDVTTGSCQKLSNSQSENGYINGKNNMSMDLNTSKNDLIGKNILNHQITANFSNLVIKEKQSNDNPKEKKVSSQNKSHSKKKINQSKEKKNDSSLVSKKESTNNANNNIINESMNITKKEEENNEKIVNKTSKEKILPTKNLTFKCQTNNLIKTDQIVDFMINRKDSSQIPKPVFLPKRINISPNDVILEGEFYFTNFIINNKLQRTKTKDVNQAKRYVIMSRNSLKLAKSKNIYISFGSIFNEVQLIDITKCELVKNPFSKFHLYTINIKFGKDNYEFSLSSEDEKEVETWYKIINLLIKSEYV